jgi:hypothetical protein
MISGLPSASKLIFTINGKWTLIFSFSGTEILNNLSSPVERGLAGTVAQEEIPNKTAPIIKTDNEFIVGLSYDDYNLKSVILA